MIHIAFSVFDSKAQAFLPPWVIPKLEMAKRVFSDCVNSEDHQFSKHPEDYTLFELGHWDDETGQFTLQRTPQSHGLGVEYVRSVDSNNQDWIEDGTEKRNDAPVLTGSEGGDTSE